MTEKKLWPFDAQAVIWFFTTHLSMRRHWSVTDTEQGSRTNQSPLSCWQEKTKHFEIQIEHPSLFDWQRVTWWNAFRASPTCTSSGGGLIAARQARVRHHLLQCTQNHPTTESTSWDRTRSLPYLQPALLASVKKTHSTFKRAHWLFNLSYDNPTGATGTRNNQHQDKGGTDLQQKPNYMLYIFLKPWRGHKLEEILSRKVRGYTSVYTVDASSVRPVKYPHRIYLHFSL